MMNKRTGIYVHIPFCVSKCHYCDFVSGTRFDLEDKYFNKLTEEIRNKRDTTRKIQTIYLGGGTPSSVEPQNIRKVLFEIESAFDLSELEEKTIEVNPGTCHNDNIRIYYDMGFDRISIGVQSFNDKMLASIGRIHSEKDIYKTVEEAKAAGFKNISIDLMYGLPDDSLSRLLEDLDKTLALGISHVSTYGLIIEPGTRFEKDYNIGLLKLPEEELLLDMRKSINKKLKEKGYERYEIANYAIPGLESRHNTIYWNNDDYYGFGLNSTTKLEDERYRNDSNLEKYVEDEDFKRYDVELLSEEMQIEESMFLGLRQTKGINLKIMSSRHNIDIRGKYKKAIDELIDIKAATLDGDNLALTEYGMEISNYCLAKFLS